MNSLNRLEKSLNLQTPDMVPVVPIIGFHSATLTGISTSVGLEDGKEMAKAQLKALKEYGYDGVFTFMDLAAEPEALGCRTKMSIAGVPMVTEPALSGLNDVGLLKPLESRKAKRLIPFLDAVRLMREEVGNEYMVSAYVSGPVTLAGNLAGIEGLLRAVIKKPEEVLKVIEYCTDAAIEYGRALQSEGVHTLAILEPTATPSILSPQQFSKFSLPYLRRIVKSLKVPVILHICGDTTISLDEMADSGAKALSIANIDLAQAKQRMGNRICLMGNVPTVEVLLKGTPSDVEKASRKCIRNAGSGGGFILSSECEVPADTPSTNIKAMVESAREYGRYPIEI
jgi:uroporphyrinogen decarboxylase